MRCSRAGVEPGRRGASGDCWCSVRALFSRSIYALFALYSRRSVSRGSRTPRGAGPGGGGGGACGGAWRRSRLAVAAAVGRAGADREDADCCVRTREALEGGRAYCEQWRTAGRWCRRRLGNRRLFIYMYIYIYIYMCIYILSDGGRQDAGAGADRGAGEAGQGAGHRKRPQGEPPSPPLSHTH